MQSEHLIWLAIVLIVGIIGLKYVYWRIARSMNELQRMAEDPEFRREKLQALESYLEKNPGDGDARLRRADLWRREGDYSRAASDLRLYLEKKPEDSEGWAELAECAILLHEKHEALTASEKARALDPNYSDYCAISLRAHLLSNNLEAALIDWERWAELDRERCQRKPSRGMSGWLGGRQLPLGDPVPDPALAIYRAELYLRKGEHDAARKMLEPVRNENAETLQLITQNDPLLKDLAAL